MKYYGMPARDFRKALDDLGLATTTGHCLALNESSISRARVPTVSPRRSASFVVLMIFGKAANVHLHACQISLTRGVPLVLRRATD